MVWSELLGEVLSSRDLPWWARGVAVVALLLASWWFLRNDSLHGLLGDSIAPLSLGVMAVFILRGMRAPMGIWPSGPWRERFSVPAVMVVAIVFALTILIAGRVGSGYVTSQVDFGKGILVVAGTVAWGFAVAFVHQRTFFGWYAVAATVGLLPAIAGLLIDVSGQGGGAYQMCFFTLGEAGAVDAESTQCAAAAVPALMFLLALGATSKLAAEELAFRRLLVGEPEGAGLLTVLIASVVATGWYGLLSLSGMGGTDLIILGSIGALTATCLYVLSRSLLVSALYSGTLSAGAAAFELSRPVSDTQNVAVLSGPAMWGTALAISIALSVLVLRRNGLVRRPLVVGESDASGN